MDQWETRLGELDAQLTAIREELALVQRQAPESEQEADPFQPEVEADRQEQSGEWGSMEHQVSRLRADLLILERNIDQNDAELDALQIKMTAGQKPWDREITTIIALLAFLFSFATTMVSYRLSAQQRIHNDRAELRVFLQRLLELSKENTMLQTDPNSQGVAGYVSSFITYETTLLVYQAVEVMDRLPGRVTANEYNLVAEMSNAIGDYNQSYKLLQQAVKVSQNANEEVSALRGLALLYYATGNREEGSATYKRALSVNERYPSMVPAYKDWTNSQTEVAWAGAELAQGNCAEARRHMQTAFELKDNVGFGVTDVYLWQLESAQAQVDACVEQAAPGTE